VGRAVEIAEELGPLEEATGGGMLLEIATVDELVGVVRLTRTPVPRRPRPAEPQIGVAFDQTRGDGSLARPARARENEDQDFAVAASRASR
jgi:hypothetical protein